MSFISKLTAWATFMNYRIHHRLCNALWSFVAGTYIICIIVMATVKLYNIATKDYLTNVNKLSF